jgi:hypothetical protein
MVASPAQAAPLDFLTISDAANWEGGNLVFTVTYTGSTDNADFDFDVIDHTTNGSDASLTASANDHGAETSPYFAGSTITFRTGSTTPQKATVTVPALDAGTDVSSETLKLRATAAGDDPTLDPITTGTGTIWDLDHSNHIVLGGATTVPETATGGVQKTVTVTATSTNPQPHDVTIPIMTADISTGTYQTTKATSLGGNNRDYTALPADAMITIPANQTSGTATVQLWDDTSDEADTQYFNVTTDGTRVPLGGDVLSAQNTVQMGIQDDDATPTISIGDSPTAKEGNQLIFPIRLSNPSELGVTANVNAVGMATGSAGAAVQSAVDNTTTTDFVWGNGSGDGTVNLPAYASSTNVMMATTTNGGVEGPENVRATLSTPSNATLGSPTTANGMITDSDAGQTLQWSTLGAGAFDNTVRDWDEGNSGPVAQKIYLKFTTGSLPTTLSYSFVDGTAKNGSDYIGTAGSIAVPVRTAANPIVSIPVTIIGDRVNEPDETFKLLVTDPSGVTNALNIGEVTFTINNDDDPPTWTTQDVTVDEGNTGTTKAMVPVTLSAPAAVDATFTAALADGSATEAAAGAGGNDYDMPLVSSVTIKAGDTTGNLEIPIVGDMVYERDESFTVAFTPPADVDNTSLDTVRTARVTIRNDDAQPKLTFGQFSGLEGTSVTVNGTVVGASQYSYDIGFSAAGNGDAPATPGTDFTSPAGLATTTVTVPAGYTGDLSALTPTPFAGLQFALNNDAVDEATETFAVTASEASAALKGFQTSVATVKIADDPLDLPPTVAIGDVSIGEWEKSVDVPVTLSFSKDNDATSTQQAVTVPYWTVDGAAKAGVNYKETKGTLTIPAGTLTANINVPVMDDKVKTTAKDFFVKLGKPGPAGATLGKDSSQVLVKDSGSGGGTTPPSSSWPTIMVPAWVTGSVAVPVTGKADPGATVDLWGAAWSAANPKLVKLDSTTADKNGAYKFSRWIGTGYRFQVASGTDMSDEMKVGIAQAPVFVASSPSKGKLSVAIQGNPRGPKQVVIVQVWSGGKWVNTWKGTTAADNLWKATVSEKSKSSWTLRAFVQGDMNVGINGGYSAAKKVTIK